MRPPSPAWLSLLAIAVWSCSRADPRASTEPPQSGARSDVARAAPIPATVASETFGAPPALSGEPLDVEQVLAAPKSYLQQTIKCRGTVARVCEAAGCWLELRADAGGAGLRVPMAGHSFFIPQRIVGNTAVVEGKLTARELSDAELAHLRGEGLSATGPLSLAATSVVVTFDTRARSGSLPAQPGSSAH